VHASIGDWLVVRTDNSKRLRAEILGVGCDGNPPFVVRWLHDGHESTVFPGPDSDVVTAKHQHELDNAEGARITQIQAEIRATAHRA
jgi:Domain of unknown function (DUF1918)